MYSEFGNTIVNKNFCIDAKGNYKSTDLIKKQANGKYVRGVQEYRNGYSSALKAASKYQAAGNIVGRLGIAVTEMHYYNNQITGTEAAFDAAFGIIGFMGSVGAGISMTYFMGKYAYEGISGNTLFTKPE